MKTKLHSKQWYGRKMSAELRLLILDHRGNKINEGKKLKERISE